MTAQSATSGDLPRTYTVKEVGLMVHLDPDTITRRLRAGTYVAMKPGKYWVFTYDQAMAVLTTPVVAQPSETNSWGRRVRRQVAA